MPHTSTTRTSTARALTSLLLLLSAATMAVGQRPARRTPPKPLAPIEDQEGLPRVLLIGDSISIGYTLPTRKLLEGKANVHRPQTNCGPSTRGLEQIDQWLGDKPWDVIHFNFGLHDLKYLGADGSNLADPEDPASRQQVPPDQYRRNLARLVERLQKTDAHLIWCATTPVPEGAQGRVPGDAVKYNQIAAEVMKEAGVEIHDLHAFASPRLKEIQRPANVHFTPAGSELLAQQVAARVERALRSGE